MGEGADKAFETLEAAIQKQPKDADLRYDAARAFSLASRAVSRSDKAKGRQLAERCLQLLREAVKNDDADFGKMDEDADLDPIRDDPAFAEIMKAGHPDRRYAAAWSSDASFEATSIYGLDPAAHLRKCRELIAQGYRPVSWSASQTATEGPLVTASVWHRPVVAEEAKDRLAERQARAAVALVRMGKAEEVWPLLRHSADPRLRSFIVNWLNPLGADPKRDRRRARPDCDSPTARAARRSPRATQKMDAILFHPETSQRRALILALGTYGTEGLSPGEREPLTGKLLDLYRNDPDSGIHGAAEWTLRQWKQQEKLKELDAELMKVKDWGERRWFVNGQGQTFAVIEGPVEFRMGSPPTETERIAGNETLRRMRHPPPVRHRRQGGHGRAIPAVLEARRHHDRPLPGCRRASSASTAPIPDGPWIGSRLVHGGPLLQLAERAGGFAEGPVVLPPQRGRGLRRGDDDPRRRARAHGLSPAHRGGMGIRLPGGCGHQPILRSLDRPAGRLCPVSGQQQGACLGVREPAPERPGVVRHAGERV